MAVFQLEGLRHLEEDGKTILLEMGRLPLRLCCGLCYMHVLILCFDNIHVV